MATDGEDHDHGAHDHGARGGGVEDHGAEGRIGVRDNPAAERYEAVRDGEIVGIMIYERSRARIDLVHTVTDPAHRGEGVASVLVRTVLAEARAAALPVLVICPFIESWLHRHPEQREGVVVED
ncbi:predicted acetyltransferase [Brachybacterium faecium DSM 4810]|jgi:predicted GNAT family acetyltransferase|uniref:Predicted acetyltransferase n=1 Tax=Brachybacterium faecium (strain ATCC 43885 / DSM 4810 / JCM 11609 / LMG 19847 / NBRC 14762 / NCIMB 9860 / 6-10) TaxID=446465 RepID=C7MGI7_BRAFD|nr:GNAT family N-acetyltransferase [Brachybacterium faecium]ACU84178.1 predicted acetyltransferase [Brachybacterium faecium DSM 4810]